MKLILSAMVVVAVACTPRAADPSPAAPTVAAATTTPVGRAPATTNGATAGVAGYPAESLPAMTIYAVSTTDRSVFFSVDMPPVASPPRPTFTITGVRPGTYNLLAYLEGNDGPAGGAYTEYVKCGLKASCSDHSLIDVTVGPGETVRGVDVSDWYAPAGTFPSRPR